MDIKNLAGSMRSRIPWEAAQKILRLNDAPTGRGWENTVEKLIGRKAKLTDHIEPLTQALVEHMMCGEKLVRLYRVKVPALKAIREKLAQSKPPKTPFSEIYPGVLSDAQLKELSDKKPQLVAVEETDNGVAGMFASVRSIETREEVDPEDLPKAAAAALETYDEILGIRLQRLQAIDSVWVPNDDGPIEVRVDYPRGMHQEAGLLAHSHVVAALQKALDLDGQFPAPINLFPLIDTLYRAKDEGRVVELAFGTTTASLKHEKMRGKYKDLRKEIYHMAGSAALKGEIEPFRLSIEWDVVLEDEVTSHPEVSFNGTSRLMGATNPTMNDVVIRKCIGVEDYEEIVSTLMSYLPKAS